MNRTTSWPPRFAVASETSFRRPDPALTSMGAPAFAADRVSAGGSVSASSELSRDTAGRRTRKLILVVDDEQDLLDLISYNLRRHGHDVVTAATGREALTTALREVPDLIVLDLMLPEMDGTEVARRLRADASTANVPIIMLTAKAEETDVVVGLTLGADDYVTKPFSMKILLARLNTILRRSETATSATTPAAPAPADAGLLRTGPLLIDLSKHEVTIDGEPIRLTLTEFKLLAALVQARGRVLNRDQLMDKGMGSDVFVTDRAIDVHVTAIRKKLGAASWLVHTVRGVGYRLQEQQGAGEE